MPSWNQVARNKLGRQTGKCRTERSIRELPAISKDVYDLWKILLRFLECGISISTSVSVDELDETVTHSWNMAGWLTAWRTTPVSCLPSWVGEGVEAEVARGGGDGVQFEKINGQISWEWQRIPNNLWHRHYLLVSDNTVMGKVLPCWMYIANFIDFTVILVHLILVNITNQSSS